MRKLQIYIDLYLSTDRDDRVNFAAFDVDGELYGYEFPPAFNERTACWYQAEDSARPAVLLGRVDPELVPEEFAEKVWEAE